MAKLPWYMKSKGKTIEFHWLWVLWQKVKYKIKRYFTEPFEDYDGNWKGIIYYEKMRMRKKQIKFWAIMTLIITGVIILNIL